MVDRDPISGVQRRVAGHHDFRLDGMTDLVLRCRGWSVLDVGCNRGMVGYEFACNGARLIHGCDIYEKGIETAREIFADMRHCQGRFEVVDLTRGYRAIEEAFGQGEYDLILLFAIVHKLIRVMKLDDLKELLTWFAQHASIYIAANVVSEHFELMDGVFSPYGFEKVQWSNISEFGLGVIWRRRNIRL